QFDSTLGIRNSKFSAGSRSMPDNKVRTAEVMEAEPGERQLLGQILISMGILDEAGLEEALALQTEKGGAIGQILIEAGRITSDDLLQALAMQNNLQMVDLNQLEIPEEVLRMISVSMAQVYRIVPISFEDNTLVV